MMKAALLAGRPYALLHLHQRVTHAQSDDAERAGEQGERNF
jgi:hypothetical protein